MATRRKPTATQTGKQPPGAGSRKSAVRVTIGRANAYVLAQVKAEAAAETKRTGRQAHLGYRPEFDDLARHQATHGLTVVAIADLFGVSKSCIKKWVREHDSFREAIQDGRDAYDSRVVNALGERALGAKIPATKVFYDSKVGRVVKVKMIEHYPPDVEAIKFWLTNRQPEEWRHRQETSLGGIPGKPIETIGVTTALSPADVYLQMIRAGAAAGKEGGGGA